MKSKKTKIVFWITTGFIFLFEGVMVLLTSQTEMAKEGIRHLGYPDYFGVILAVFKVCGSVLIILPQVKGRVKEWVYAGFGFDFTFAFLSILAVDGWNLTLIPAVVSMIALILSYRAYHKLQKS